MAKPKNIILTREGVITTEALIAYADGSMIESDVRSLELLLVSDPFAQEALEGIKQQLDKKKMTATIIDLKEQLREKTGVKERKVPIIAIHWATYAYAAVIVGVLVGIGFVLVHFVGSPTQQLAITAPAATDSMLISQQPAKPIVVDTPAITAIDTSGVKPGTQPAIDAPATDATTTATTSPHPAVASASSTAADNLNTKEPKPISVPTAAPKAEDALAAKGTAETDALYMTNAKKSLATKDNMTEKAKSASPDPTGNPLKDARATFSAGDYVAAARKYDEILASDNSNSEALYFGGVSNFYNGFPGLAQINFDKLLAKGQYVEGSKWYKANILLKKGKTDDAKNLLRDLINGTSNYKDRATKKYDEINK